MRPTSVTVIAIIIIVMNGFSLVVTPLSTLIPEAASALEAAGMSVTATVIWAIVGGLLGLASGIGMLRGLNWGRQLYFVYVPLSVVLGWLFFGFEPLSLVSVAIYGLFVWFLTRPAANAFFMKQATVA